MGEGEITFLNEQFITKRKVECGEKAYLIQIQNEKSGSLQYVLLGRVTVNLYGPILERVNKIPNYCRRPTLTPDWSNVIFYALTFNFQVR